MSTLSSVPEENKLTSKDLAVKLLHQHLVSVEAEDSFDGEEILVSDYDEIISKAEALINKQIKSVLTELEKELRLDDDSGEPHFSHVCPKDSIECAEFAQRLQTRHWQGLAIQKIRSRYED